MTTVSVVYADDEMEEHFRQLAQSSHPEDKQLVAFMRRVRSAVRRRYKRGIPASASETPYRTKKNGHGIRKLVLWGDWTVTYEIVADEIRIIDEF